MHYSIASLLLGLTLLCSGCQAGATSGENTSTESELSQAGTEQTIENEVVPKLAESKKIVVAFAPSKNTYLLWGQEQRGEEWITTYDTVQCVVGYNGIAAPGKKREGDGKTPSGTFTLGDVFVYDNDLGLEDNFIELEPYHYWMSDTASAAYNTLIDYDPAPLYAEKMERSDVLYKYGVIINYNTDPVVAGLGSAIFLHIYRSPKKPTAGCVAVSEADLVQLIHWFQNAKETSIQITE